MEEDPDYLNTQIWFAHLLVFKKADATFLRSEAIFHVSSSLGIDQEIVSQIVESNDPASSQQSQQVLDAYWSYLWSARESREGTKG